MAVSTSIRPRGSSDIFAESAWRPSLERYISGATSSQRNTPDNEMIAQVFKALKDRDEVRVDSVSMLQAMLLCSSSIADG